MVLEVGGGGHEQVVTVHRHSVYVGGKWVPDFSNFSDCDWIFSKLICRSGFWSLGRWLKYE